MAASRSADPRTATQPRPDRPIRISLLTDPRAAANTTAQKKTHAKPYSVCPPMNSLMIDVGGIAAISSGESATI